mgnify:CR=1 FL=1
MNIKVENNDLVVNDEIVLSVGSVLVDKLNKFRKFKVSSMDLHFIKLEKIAVGEFEKQELGKGAERQTKHFLDGTSGLILSE